MSQQRCDLWRLQQSASRKCKGSIYTVYRYTETYIFFTQAGVMAGVGEGENAPASSLSLTFLGMCTLLCITVYSFWHPAAIVEYHLSIKMSLFNKYSPLWSSYGKRAKQHAGTGTCREYTVCRWCRDVYLQTVMRFFRSTPTLRADAFFDVRPIAIAVWMQPDSIQRRPRGLFGIRAQARTPPSPPVSYKHPLSSAGSRGCCCWRRRTGKRRAASS